MTRTIFPSRTLPLMCERYTLRNVGAKPLTVSVPEFSQVVTTDAGQGPARGSYVVRGDMRGQRHLTLAAGGLARVRRRVPGLPGRGEPLHPDVAASWPPRMAFVRECIDANLVLETPDPGDRHPIPLCQAAGCREHRCDQGRLHARPPGGESYYAAIWANDQAEYVNPFFPFLGYGVGNASRSTRSAISPAS